MKTKSFETVTNFDTIPVHRHIIYTKVYDNGNTDNGRTQHIELTFVYQNGKPLDVTGKVVTFWQDKKPTEARMSRSIAEAILIANWDTVNLS